MSRSGAFGVFGGSNYMSDEKSETITIPQGANMETMNEAGQEIIEPLEPLDTETNATALNELTSDAEPTIYDVQDQENFARELLTQNESGKNLYRQIHSKSFLDESGSFSAETISAAKANGMSDQEIQNHQASIHQQLLAQRDELFASTDMPIGYMTTVVQWAMSSFTNAEKTILMNGLNGENPTGELKALEKYYQKTFNGESK